MTAPEVIQAAIAKALERQPAAPRQSNYMSDIGHACERYLVYARVAWDKSAPFGSRIASIMPEGDMHEAAVLDLLRKGGVEIREQQARLFDDYTKLSGRVDAVFRIGGVWYVADVKSTSPWVYEAVNSEADVLASRFFWIRHWYPKIQAYLHHDREKNRREAQGLVVLKNRENGGVKAIEITYDQDAALDLMLKAERVNRAVEAKVMPERISPALGYCATCRFRLECLPDTDPGPGIEVLDDAELVEMLERRADLEGGHREYEGIDKAVKKSMKGRNVVAGDWMLRSVDRHRKGYEVKESDYVEVQITRLKERVGKPDDTEE